MQRQTNFDHPSPANVDALTNRALADESSPAGRQRSGSSAELAERFEAGLLWIEEFRLRPVIGLVIALCVAPVVLGWWYLASAESTALDDSIAYVAEAGSPNSSIVEMQEPNLSTQPATSSAPGSQQSEGADSVTGQSEGRDGAADSLDVALLVVHVVGEVRRPGLVSIEAPGRVADAIEEAGGFTPMADSDLLNLASLVQDGTQIVVPTIGDEITLPLIRPSSATAPVDSNLSGPGVASGEAAKVNVNTATRAELTSLPGIGPATASAIVAWRQENGAFLVVDDLEFVPGIGPVKLEALKNRVTV